VILRVAGAIYASRRKTHGGPKPKTFPCRWCTASCLGRRALAEHERQCAAKPDLWPDVIELRSLLAD
jgi:hypothetical protein